MNKHNQQKSEKHVARPASAPAAAEKVDNGYSCPLSLGTRGPWLSTKDFNDMHNWPELQGWYDYAVKVGNFSGSYPEYVASLKARCSAVI